MTFQTSSEPPLLKRENVIRQSGILLVLSPFGNFFIAAAASGIARWWRPINLWNILQGVSVISWVLWISSVSAGMMMMKGRRNSWGPVLAIIAVNLFVEIFFFSRDASSWFLPMASIVADILLFALIYSQEFHQKVQKKLGVVQMSRTFQAVGAHEFPILFEGFGSWARIVGLDERGLFVRPTGEKVPTQIKTRAVELRLGPNLILKAQFSQMRGEEYYFQFYDLTEEALEELRAWASSLQSLSTPLRSDNEGRIVA